MSIKLKVFYKKVIEEWEYLALKFKPYPEKVAYINKTIKELKKEIK